MNTTRASMWRCAGGGTAARRSTGATTRAYETVGYMIADWVLLHLAGQMVLLEPGDSWVVSKGALHTYQILELFTAIEALPHRHRPVYTGYTAEVRHLSRQIGYLWHALCWHT